MRKLVAIALTVLCSCQAEPQGSHRIAVDLPGDKYSGEGVVVSEGFPTGVRVLSDPVTRYEFTANGPRVKGCDYHSISQCPRVPVGLAQGSWRRRNGDSPGSCQLIMEGRKS